MLKGFCKYIKLLYYILLGHLLLLISAVYEKGSTDFSKRLIPNTFQVPEMIEALLAAVTVLVFWAFLYCFLKSRADD